MQTPEEWSLVKCKKNRIIVHVTEVNLTSTDDDGNARTETLDFRKPVFVDTAKCSWMYHRVTDQHHVGSTAATENLALLSKCHKKSKIGQCQLI